MDCHVAFDNNFDWDDTEPRGRSAKCLISQRAEEVLLSTTKENSPINYPPQCGANGNSKELLDN